MTEITQDEIIGIVAGHDSMSIRGIQRELGTTQSGKVSSLITQMVRNETLRRVKGRIELNDPPKYENSGRSMETTIPPLPTDKGFVIRKEKRTEKAKMDVPTPPPRERPAAPPREKPMWPPPLQGSGYQGPEPIIATLEDAEQAADEEKARDQRIRDAIAGLKRKAKRAETNIDPVADFHFKLEVLDGIGQTDSDIMTVMGEIIVDLRRLQALSEATW